MRAEAGELDLYYLDEAGFASTLPTGYTWARRGTRAVVYQEGTSGRRVNALGALRTDGGQPRLVFRTTTGKVTSDLLLDFIYTQVAGLAGPPSSLAIASRSPRHRPCTTCSSTSPVPVPGATCYPGHGHADQHRATDKEGGERKMRTASTPHHGAGDHPAR
ncbi:transposase [Streptomyces sp. NPDC059534]|uniref:transposase n=1 Tax=Streptomyces sp. NPDC059534 TaxID=3346859 RepID=UPI0036820F0B